MSLNTAGGMQRITILKENVLYTNKFINGKTHTIFSTTMFCQGEYGEPVQLTGNF